MKALIMARAKIPWKFSELIKVSFITIGQSDKNFQCRVVVLMTFDEVQVLQFVRLLP